MTPECHKNPALAAVVDTLLADYRVIYPKLIAVFAEAGIPPAEALVMLKLLLGDLAAVIQAEITSKLATSRTFPIDPANIGGEA